MIRGKRRRFKYAEFIEFVESARDYFLQRGDISIEESKIDYLTLEVLTQNMKITNPNEE